MTDTVRSLKERSRKRRELLAQQLGVRDPADLAAVLGNREATRDESASKATKSLKSRTKEPEVFVVAKTVVSDDKSSRRKSKNPTKDKDADDDVEVEDYFKVLQKEEEYKGSHTFLKGTQSANPHNDYSQHFVDTNQRPQNFIRDSGLAERFEEYPKLKELIHLKDDLVQITATPPMYLKCDPREMDLAELGCKFDVIIVEPPLEEYQRHGVVSKQCWTWEMIEQLNIPAVADWRCFIWLWCGSSDGLSWGRRCLKTWGFRRCEDICWIKTNKSGQREHINVDPGSLFQRTKEHCLMGIKGTVRRSVDGDFIHANVDIDLIISEEPDYGSSLKPEEIYLIAEHFCLGRRRLHVFGSDDTIRQGWLTIGPDLTSSNFDLQLYRAYFEKEPGQTTGCTKEIEMLRPKSPTQNRTLQGNAASPDREPPPPGFNNPPPPGTSSSLGHVPRSGHRSRSGSNSKFSSNRKDYWNKRNNHRRH